MKIEEILAKLKENNIAYQVKNLNHNIEVEGVSINSKYLNRNWMYVWLAYNHLSGYQFIKEAEQKGACAIISPIDIPNTTLPVIIIAQPQLHLQTISQIVYDVNLNDFFFIGVTGTNGKTTTTYLIEYLLNQSGINCCKIGTIEYKALDYSEKSYLTTPDIVTITRILKEAKKRNCKYVVMEASSHGLAQKRFPIEKFFYAVFTNIGLDHLDYHQTMENYIQAKATLFREMNKDGISFINMDDQYASYFINSSKGKVITYGTTKKATATFTVEKTGLNGTSFTLFFDGKEYKFNTKLIGLHNVYNIVASFLVSHFITSSPSLLCSLITHFPGVPGRLECVYSNRFTIFIDYAHTPQALKNSLQTLSDLKEKNARVICVFGCGGDRDKSKRPIMGEIASKYSHIVILTSDNPRSEDPQSIIEEIKTGINSDCTLYIQPDRKEAIRKAINLAKKGDIILIAGKGHEDYQILKDKTIPFSDKETVLQLCS
jgi:UDP-N-acetylmuramoyl-L-alanyl-D-glutamate--2,6-diaminopimelate ligase